MVSIYDGFTPDRRPKYIVQGTGILFFLTAGWLALSLFPLLFMTGPFQEMSRSTLNPTQEQVISIVAISLEYLAWVLAPFIIAGLALRFRRAAIYLGALLSLAACWWLERMPFEDAGNILLLVAWTLLTILLIIYRNELD